MARNREGNLLPGKNQRTGSANFRTKMHVKSPGATRKLQSCAVYKSTDLRNVSMARNGDEHLRPRKYQRAESAKITGESQPLNHHLAMDPSYVQHDITKDNVHEIYKLFEALAVFKRTNIEEIKQIMKAEQDLSEQTRVISKLKKHVELMDEEAKSAKAQLREKDRQLLTLIQERNWNVENEQLAMRHNDLQQKYEEIQYESQAMAMYKLNLENEIETLRSKLRKTERESLQQKCDISRLKEYVKSADEESSFLKAQLQEQDMQILKQKQERYWNVEQEQVELRDNVLQREFDNKKYMCQAMMIDKIKLNNEIEILRSTLRKTKEEFLEKTNEMSRIKKHVELVVEESKSLIAQLHEKDIQLLKQKERKLRNVEHEQLEIMYNDLQRKFDKTKDESQAILMDKRKLENENEKLCSMLRKTEHELSEKTKEITKLEKHVESVKDESKSFKAQLQKKHMLLLKQNQGRNRNREYEKLEMRHKDLQRKYDMIRNESQWMVMNKTKLENENEELRRKLRTTEQESSQQKSEIFRLKKLVKSADEESKSQKEQLQEKKMQLLKQKQGRNVNVEYKQLEMRYKDLQQKFDKLNDDYQSMGMDKTKLETEIKKLRSLLMKTDQDFVEKTSKLSGPKKRVESMDEETKSIKAQLQEREMQLLEQKQGQNLKHKYEQLEMRHKDLQQKFDKLNDDYQSMGIDKTHLETDIRTLRDHSMKTEQEFSEKISELSRLNKRVESMDEATESLNAQLQEKMLQLQEQKKGKILNVEYEQLEMRHKDLQQKFDTLNDDYQSMGMDKAKLETEIKTLREQSMKTDQDFSEKTSELSRLKKRVESMDGETKSLKAQLQEREMQLLEQKQGQNLKHKYEQLEMRNKDLQQKFDKTKDDYQSMGIDKTQLDTEIRRLRDRSMKIEQELSEKINELSRFKKRVESMDEETESLKAQLQEKEIQLQEQKQGKILKVEYEQLEMRHKDLQQKFDKLNDDYQSIGMDKAKLETEIKKLRDQAMTTEEKFSEKTSELSGLKKRVESMNEETKSLKAQLQESEMQLLEQKQGRNIKVEYEQLKMRHKDLQQQFDKIKDDYQSIGIDKTHLETEIKKLRDQSMKTEQEFSEKTSELSRFKKLVESMDEETKSLKAQLQEKEMQLLEQKQGRNMKVESKQLEMRHEDLQLKFDKIKEENQVMIVYKTKLENENEKLSTLLRKAEHESLGQKSEISKLKRRVQNLDQELESFQAQLQDTERKLQEQKLATKKAYAEKDEALTRLSRHMGQQMSEGNPNITDLSDQNRPSKLGERYSELYDNQWTDAFEVLTDKFAKDDKEAIEVLRTILLETYKRALDFSISQMKEAEYKLSGSTKGVGPECKRLLKEARKNIDIKQADSLMENVLEVTLSKVVDTRYLSEKMVQVFAKECFQLCWFMSIQDPPVALVEDPIQGSRFDTNVFKHYTNSGDTVEYVVWPALLLHKDGPLLTKGVAQPFSRPR